MTITLLDYSDLIPPEKLKSWVLLNPASFDYGGEDILEALNITKASPFTDKPETPGLINYYAMVSAQEDRAEVLSQMMVHSDYLRRAADNDEHLRNKIAMMKNMIEAIDPQLEALFSTRSPRRCPAMIECPL